MVYLWIKKENITGATLEFGTHCECIVNNWKLKSIASINVLVRAIVQVKVDVSELIENSDG